MTLHPDGIKPKRLPKKAVQGKFLLDRIFERDYDKGATFVEISGIPGCGKTGLALGMAERIMKNNPNELLFWREGTGSPCQFAKLEGKYQILAEKSYPLKVLEITNDLLPADIPIRYFRSYQELIGMAKPGMLNVVYFKDLYKWVDFLDRLRLLPDWQTCFWDEYEDIAPQRCKGIVWQKNDKLANTLKQLRKSRVGIIANTQSSMDADFRVRSKLMYWIYLFGARKDELSPVSKGAVHSLRIGAGWVDHGHSLYGEFTFPPYLPKSHIYVVLPVEQEESL